MRFSIVSFGTVVCLGLASAAALADVTGKVMLDGKAPEAHEIDLSGVKDCADLHVDPIYEETIVASSKNELANVVVSIDFGKTAPPKAAAMTAPATIDQKGCVYVPHVIAIQAGQPLSIKNDDPFLHNSHSLAELNPVFNVSQPTKDDGSPVPTATTTEQYRIKCDVHPWMSAWVAVFTHPFFAVTGKDGTFAIKGLPDGTYTVQAWQETLGNQTGQVTVKEGKGELTLTYKAPTAMNNSTDRAMLASASTGESIDCPACDAAAEAAHPSTQPTTAPSLADATGVGR